MASYIAILWQICSGIYVKSITVQCCLQRFDMIWYLFICSWHNSYIKAEQCNDNSTK